MARSITMIAFFIFMVGLTNGALPSQVYWNTMLPNTPMPNAIIELLNNGAFKEGKVNIGIGIGGIIGVGVNVGNGSSTSGGVGVGVGVGGLGFNYQYSATDDQLNNNPNVALFFLEKDLKAGKKMNLRFTKMTSDAAFLSQVASKSIPFSSSKFSEILTRFSIKPDSQAAQVMSKTIEECEQPAAKGETKYCATSLESMVNFAISSLKSRNLLALSTVVNPNNAEKQQYTILPKVRSIGEEKNGVVACHAEPYVYAVFLCHLTKSSKVYVVPMIGEDGETKVEAVAVCHTDTSTWNPNHLAFKVLKMKPGTVPICHFLPQDHLVWTLKN